MKVTRRRQAMLDAVLAGMTEVEALCAHFGVSEATVRRDLGALARQGLVVRTYGGATARLGPREPELTLEQRRERQGDVKAGLARLALERIHDGDTLLLDGGTTTAALAHCLRARRGLHVLTNNLAALSALGDLPEGHVTILGGDLRVSSMTAYGRLAHAALERISVDRVFMSADGVVADMGLCEASPEQAWLKEAMIQRAAEVFIMADATKLGRASQQHWTPLPRHWTLITDADDDTLLDAFRLRGAEICNALPTPHH
ncbi:DeoR/GlpR family DNA-binding transcription regulator [Kushneria phosphatilytica]|uniref:DeoR/GlpR transcriptional regulator n=1 Tax=Kushneria phosphatilytica TaxID=657387 RepID=A0A1S1NRD6_9GAMM|nr:DeoR/GlpR family DNA-binding transcription regulator [Kushneria phosphatilytica]OHV07662.1 DeoR family transcriptional regulator [Kushneria phosphatilytica]QEL10154.1 DeoR/GlpR transcriptional regulator [Kushneria phosphatilytica]